MSKDEMKVTESKLEKQRNVSRVLLSISRKLYSNMLSADATFAEELRKEMGTLRVGDFCH